MTIKQQGGIFGRRPAFSNVEVKSLSADTADINGGTIDDTVIGDVTPASINGTTGTFSGNLEVNTDTLYVDSGNDRVGIGKSSPAYALDVITGTDNSVVASFSGNVSSRGLKISTFLSTGTNDVGVDLDAVGASGSYGVLTLSTNSSEAMRIDSSGNLLVGTTNPTIYTEGSGGDAGFVAGPQGEVQASRSSNTALRLNRMDSVGPIANFRYNGSTVGTISVTASATAYNTSSDYRLKEDVQPMVGASDRVLALKPVNFAWKVDGTRVDGFLAHEAQEVVPEAITGTKDAVDDEGNPEYQGIDQSKLVPLLTAALQEALGRIETLEAEMATLKGQ